MFVLFVLGGGHYKAMSDLFPPTLITKQYVLLEETALDTAFVFL